MKRTTTKAKKTTKGINRPMVKTVDQLTLARIIAQKHEIPIAEVLEIVVEEQKLTMQFVNDGYRVIKKNYLTMEAKQYESKTWVSPLDKKTYETGEHRRVLVRIGEGFKSFLNDNKKMEDRLCRFIVEKKDENYTKNFTETP